MTTKKPSEKEVELIIAKYTSAAGVAGIIPIPGVDIASITSIQLKMIATLAEAYSISFSEHSGRSMITSLVASVGAASFARSAVGSAIKAIPGIGSVIGALTLPVFAGAATYAVGRVFNGHFKSGGTLLDFDPETAKTAFRESYEEGKAYVKDLLETMRDLGEEFWESTLSDRPSANQSDNRKTEYGVDEEQMKKNEEYIHDFYAFWTKSDTNNKSKRADDSNPRKTSALSAKLGKEDVTEAPCKSDKAVHIEIGEAADDSN